MRRPLKALALLLGAVGIAAQSASTASNSLPSSTAVYRATTVTGAAMVSLDYTISAGQITGLTATLRGTGLLDAAVTAQFSGDPAVLCTRVSLNLLDLLTGLREGTYTCSPLLESADRPAPLQITAS